MTTSFGYADAIPPNMTTFQMTLARVFAGIGIVSFFGLPCALVVAFLIRLWRTLFPQAPPRRAN